MSNRSGYKQQQNLSSIQLLAEVPGFIASLLSAVFTGTVLIYVDLLDSFSYILRNAMVVLLSRKLSKDLQFEYNYGIGKIEAVSSLFSDAIVLLGMLLTLCVSVYSLSTPGKPSELLIGVAVLKLFDLMWDGAFFTQQRKILKTHRSAISETTYAAALGDLLFDCVAFISIFAMWLFRNNPIGGYLSPVISIFVALYLMAGCIKRIRTALNDLTDKTLPEEDQMKILKILTRYFDSYSQVHSVDSRKSGDLIMIDIHLSFENNASVEDVTNLQKQMQEEFDSQFDNCIVKIIVKDD